MRALKGKQFARWAKNECITDADLRTAAVEALAGQVEADLGSYLFKKRIARSGAGKSGGHRTILGFRKGADRVFFLFGFSKNKRATITEAERTALGALAASLIDATEEQLGQAITRGTVVKLECEE